MESSQTDAHSVGLTGTVSPPYLQCVCSQVVAGVAEADNAIQTSVRPPGNQTGSPGTASAHPDCLPHSARDPPRYNACPACVLGAGKLSTGRSITDFMGWTLQEKRHPHRGLTPAERIEGMGLAANICITIMRANILCRGVVLQGCRVRLGLRGVHLQLLNGHASGVPEHPHRGRAVAERVGG